MIDGVQNVPLPSGVLSLWMELRARRVQSGANSNTAASFHNVAALLSLMAIASVVMVRLHDDLSGFYQAYFPLLDWFALVSSAFLMAACLWDREAKYAVAGLYLLYRERKVTGRVAPIEPG